jgi:hypothetical protein
MFTEHLDDENEDGAISRYGVGVMLSSLEIWRALMTDEMRQERRDWDEERKQADQVGPSLRPASLSADENDEYASFERLARSLVQVPKTELDAERNKREASE